MQNPFEEINQKLEAIQREQREIKDLLQRSITDKEPRDLLTVHMAAEFLDLSPATLYSKSSRGEIPSKRQGGRLYFSKKELLQWIEEGAKSPYSIDHLSNARGPQKKEVFMPWTNERFIALWDCWKDHISRRYKVEYSNGEEQRQLNRLQKMSGGILDAALEIITVSIDEKRKHLKP